MNMKINASQKSAIMKGINMVIRDLVLGRVGFIFWLRSWRQTSFQSPRNTLALISSICHVSFLSKSFGSTAHKALKLSCIMIVSGKSF